MNKVGPSSVKYRAGDRSLGVLPFYRKHKKNLSKSLNQIQWADIYGVSAVVRSLYSNVCIYLPLVYL